MPRLFELMAAPPRNVDTDGLMSGIVWVAIDGATNRHSAPTETAPAEGQKENGLRRSCVEPPSEVSRLDHPHTIPQMQINASTPKTIISSRSVGLEAASISVW